MPQLPPPKTTLKKDPDDDFITAKFCGSVFSFGAGKYPYASPKKGSSGTLCKPTLGFVGLGFGKGRGGVENVRTDQSHEDQTAGNEW